MSEVFSLDPHALEQFLERRRASLPNFEPEMSLADNLVEVLRKANEFVPSEAGSILLDNPRLKQVDRSRNRLTFLAAFGDKAQLLVGQTLPADQGIAGHVYLSGKAYSSTDVASDRFFDASVDAETQYRTQSLVAIPIRIGTDVCGVLELINRRGAASYSEHERDLLEIFADYISIAIQNVLDGRLAQEAAKRDNLTGLYNDRYLHSALEQTLARCRADGRDLALLFLDLDYFKLVNDRHGHLAGSQVLRETGQLLRRVGRPRARAGGALRRRRVRDRHPGHSGRGGDGDRRAPASRCRERGLLQRSGRDPARAALPLRARLLDRRGDAVASCAEESRASRSPRASCCDSPTRRCTAPRRPAATG